MIACHVQFEWTLIAALLVVVFAALVAATLALLHFHVVNRKLDRVMRAMRLDPAEDEIELPTWLAKIGGARAD
jgi:hypothetical protein